MKEKKPPLALRVRLFRAVEAEERQNPASLRRIVFDLIYHHFDKSATKAAESLSHILRRQPGKRAFRRGFEGGSLYKATRDKQPITYTQLDAIALYHRMPLGLLLLFSRVRSELERAQGKGAVEPRRIVNAARAALSVLDERLSGPLEGRDAYEHLDHQAFIQFRDAYLNEYDQTLI